MWRAGPQGKEQGNDWVRGGGLLEQGAQTPARRAPPAQYWDQREPRPSRRTLRLPSSGSHWPGRPQTHPKSHCICPSPHLTPVLTQPLPREPQPLPGRAGRRTTDPHRALAGTVGVAAEALTPDANGGLSGNTPCRCNQAWMRSWARDKRVMAEAELGTRPWTLRTGARRGLERVLSEPLEGASPLTPGFRLLASGAPRRKSCGA